MSKFKQQMLPAYRPVPTYTSTMTCFFVFGVLISAVGIVLLIMSNSITQHEVLYDVLCPDEYGVECDVKFQISEHVQQPIFL